jgi:hypothetical protein
MLLIQVILAEVIPIRKEVKTMKYNKPTIGSVAATKAIQSGSKLIHLVQDANFPQQTTPSNGAYESDE